MNGVECAVRNADSSTRCKRVFERGRTSARADRSRVQRLEVRSGSLRGVCAGGRTVQRDTEVAFERLLGEYQVPENVCTDKLASYGAAIHELPRLGGVEHQQVISTARCNNSIEQSHQPTRGQECSQLGFRQVKWAQGFLALHARISNLHACSRSTAPANDR
jgi:hypothetical protein